jgi:hypothetical protein
MPTTIQKSKRATLSNPMSGKATLDASKLPGSDFSLPGFFCAPTERVAYRSTWRSPAGSGVSLRPEAAGPGHPEGKVVDRRSHSDRQLGHGVRATIRDGYTSCSFHAASARIGTRHTDAASIPAEPVPGGPNIRRRPHCADAGLIG